MKLFKILHFWTIQRHRNPRERVSNLHASQQFPGSQNIDGSFLLCSSQNLHCPTVFWLYADKNIFSLSRPLYFLSAQGNNRNETVDRDTTTKKAPTRSNREPPVRLIQSASVAKRRLRDAQVASLSEAKSCSIKQVYSSLRPKTSPERISIGKISRAFDHFPSSSPVKMRKPDDRSESCGSGLGNSRQMGQCPFCMVVFIGEHTTCSANFGRPV